MISDSERIYYGLLCLAHGFSSLYLRSVKYSVCFQNGVTRYRVILKESLYKN